MNPDVLRRGEGKIGHATQNSVKSALVRTIITLQGGQNRDMAYLAPNTVKEYFTPIRVKGNYRYS